MNLGVDYHTWEILKNILEINIDEEKEKKQKWTKEIELYYSLDEDGFADFPDIECGLHRKADLAKGSSLQLGQFKRGLIAEDW